MLTLTLMADVSGCRSCASKPVLASSKGRGFQKHFQPSHASAPLGVAAPEPAWLCRLPLGPILSCGCSLESGLFAPDVNMAARFPLAPLQLLCRLPKREPSSSKKGFSCPTFDSRRLEAYATDRQRGGEGTAAHT